MSAAPDFDPIRAGFLARLATKLNDARVPGGDLATWLAPLPTAALAAATYLTPEATRIALFRAVGMARSRDLPGLDQNLFEGSPVNVPTSALAGGALNAWAAVWLARDLLRPASPWTQSAWSAAQSARRGAGPTRSFGASARSSPRFTPRPSRCSLAISRTRSRDGLDTVLPWPASRSRKSVPLEVDFAEIAHALAHLNRFSGNAMTPVSVGLHTLLGLDLCASATERVYWLLHDCHEARLGEVTTPMKAATAAIAAELYGADLAARIEDVRRTLERRHDQAIYRAAGLPLPDALVTYAIKAVDLRALATERRDFCRRGPSPRDWAIDAMTPPVQPSPKVWRWLSPAEVSDRLIEAFRTHLPALQRGRRAS